MIERTSRPGDRQDYFRIADAPYHRLLEGAVERMARARAIVERAGRDLPADWQGTQRRLADLGDFYASAEDNTRRLLARLAEQQR